MERIVPYHIYPFHHHCNGADAGKGKGPVKEYTVTEKGPAPAEGGHFVTGNLEQRLAGAHEDCLCDGKKNQSEHKTTAMALS